MKSKVVSYRYRLIGDNLRHVWDEPRQVASNKDDNDGDGDPGQADVTPLQLLRHSHAPPQLVSLERS